MSQFRPPQSGPSGTEQQNPQWQPVSNPQWQSPSQPLPLQQQWQQHSQPWSPQQQQPALPPKRRLKKRWIVIAVVVLIVIISAAAASHGSSPTATTSTPTAQATTQSTTQPTTQATAKPTSKPTQAPVTPTPAKTFLTFGDGTFQVGKDIQPGTYRTRVGSSGCYYARLKGFSGSLDDILANNNTDAPAIVTIAPTDKGFESTNCGTWTQDLSQITTSKTTFDDGMYIVGTDIVPGTYKNTGSSGCYYARLSGFTNTIDSIISNNNTDAVAIVTIAASDKGFESTRCGTWTKV